MQAAGARSVGLEVELDRAIEARARGLKVAAGVGELLPFPNATFDTVLLHEVLEHVANDHLTLAEISRVLRRGGRCVIFVPNRGWPFETHGLYLGGRYRFGNAPFVNYLPDPLRNRLAPHVRVYTQASLRRLYSDLPFREVAWQGVFPGYDKLAERRPVLAKQVRRVSGWLERTPLHRLGLSHFLVLERA
jgi:SAM-dependent methyltransferase